MSENNPYLSNRAPVFRYMYFDMKSGENKTKLSGFDRKRHSSRFDGNNHPIYMNTTNSNDFFSHI